MQWVNILHHIFSLPSLYTGVYPGQFRWPTSTKARIGCLGWTPRGEHYDAWNNLFGPRNNVKPFFSFDFGNGSQPANIKTGNSPPILTELERHRALESVKWMYVCDRFFEVFQASSPSFSLFFSPLGTKAQICVCFSQGKGSKWSLRGTGNDGILWDDLLKNFEKINANNSLDILLYLMFGDDERMYTSKKEMYGRWKALNAIDWLTKVREFKYNSQVFKSSATGLNSLFGN